MYERAVRTVALFATWALTGVAYGIDPTPITTADSVTATLVSDVTAIVPGSPFTIGVKFDVPAGYYTYYKTPGSIGLPTKVSFTAPKGFAVGAVEFPAPVIKHEDIADTPIANFVYTHSTLVFATVAPPATATPGTTVELTANVSYQYCKESGVCVAPRPQTLKLSLPVAARGQSRASEFAAAFTAAHRALPVPVAQSKYAKVQLMLNQDKIRPGDHAVIAAVVDVQPGHKLQMHRPVVKGLISTDLVLDTVPGIEPLPYPNYPPADPPKSPEAGFEDAYEYHGRFVITAPVVASDSLSGTEVRFSGLFRYQACTLEGSCFPPQFVAMELTVPVAAKNSPVAPSHHDIFSAALRGSKVSK